MMYMRYFSVCIQAAVIIMLSAGAVSAAGMTPAVQAEFDAVHAEAFTLIAQGEVMGAAMRIVETLRAMPSENPAGADAFTGPFQLLAFSISALMDWPARTALEKQLDIEKYPTDKLLTAFMYASSGSQQKAASAYGWILQLMESGHQPARVTALFIMAQPYYFKKLHMHQNAITQLVLFHQDLQLTQTLLEMPVYYTIKDALKEDNSEVYLFEDVLYAGGRREPVLAASPALARMAETMPELKMKNITPAAVGAWARIARDDADANTRYHHLCMIGENDDTETARAAARDALREIAARKSNTPETVRARVLLAEHARARHDAGELNSLCAQILGQEVLACVPERNLYEASLHAVQHAIDYCVLHGWHDRAAALLDGLAGKYPASPLAEKSAADAAEIRAERTNYSLEKIAIEERRCKEDTDALRKRYKGIAANSPDAALRRVMYQRLEKL
jgi:hypothetical protein